jgi:hypothetical protein
MLMADLCWAALILKGDQDFFSDREIIFKSFALDIIFAKVLKPWSC